MGFAGNLTTLSLEEVFQTINRIRGTGVLRLASSDAGRDVVFKDGEIIGVAFRQGEERQALLRRLILQGKIDATAAAAISSSGHDSDRIIEALIGHGNIAATEAREAIRQQAEDELLNLCTWGYADFVFQDAGPSDPDTSALVEKSAQHALSIGVNSVLMESARRQDEWTRIKADAPVDAAVLGPASGREQELAERGRPYPASAVIPLIDAVRSTADIVRDAVVTRLDVLAILTELKRDGLICTLSREDMLAHAEWRAQQQDFINAARLYRQLLAGQPDDKTLHIRLAEALAGLGENPEAAGCFSQLALGWLAEHNIEEALAAALRATSLAPQDPQLRLILVRCLLEHGEKQEAVEELRKVVTRFLQLGQLEDARSTCLKILELDPGNAQVREAMAHIFAGAEHDAESEDVAVCATCGHVNEREAQTCAGCGAGLRLTCNGCGRTVSVSDRLCIFCGVDPHAGQRRQPKVSPATAKIGRKTTSQQLVEGASSRPPGPDSGVRPGIQGLRARLEDLKIGAQQHEQAGRWAEALDAWREIAKYEVDDQELRQRIRDLESRVHDDFIERNISLGHALRRSRRFWSALRCYKKALRSMAGDDGRAQRLQQLIVATEKVHLKASAIYGGALLILGVLAILVAKPYVRQHRFNGDMEAFQAHVGQWFALKPAERLAGFAEIDAGLVRLDDQAGGLRSQDITHARSGLLALRAQAEVARIEAGRLVVAEAQKAVARKDAVTAEQQLATLGDLATRPPFSHEVAAIQARLKEGRTQQADLQRRRQEAPRSLEAAKEDEKGGDLIKALAAYRSVAELNVEPVSAEAKAAAERLGRQEAEFLAAWKAVADTAARDLVKAGAELEPLAAAAQTWGRGAELAERRAALRQTLDTAAAEWQKLAVSRDAAALERFAKAFANAPQAVRARERIASLRQEQQLKAGQREAYDQAMAGRRYDEAWQRARTLASFGEVVPLPLVVQSQPAGAEVSIGTEVKGRTPCVLELRPDLKGRITVASPGWRPVQREVAEALGEWRWQVAMTRQERWRTEISKQPIGQVLPGEAGGLLVQGGDSMVMLEADGRQRWRCGLGALDEMGDGDRQRTSHIPLPLGDGRMALGLPGGGLALVDGRGQPAGRWPSQDRVRGRPILYTNDILAVGQTRLAMAAEALWCGPVADNPAMRIPLPAPALTGPIAVSRDTDRLLVVATSRGHILAFEESTRRLAWDHDLRSAQFGQFVPLSEDQVVMVLNDNLLACFQFTANGVEPRWSMPLGGSAVGDPQLMNGRLLLSVGNAVVQIGVDGSAGPRLPLPEVASSPPAMHQDTVAVGCRDRTLVVFRRGERVWTTTCPAVPTAVGCTSDAIIVGLADGSVAAYAP